MNDSNRNADISTAASSPKSADWDWAEGAPPRRRRLVPLLLFIATVASTFWVGVCHWQPVQAWAESFDFGDSIFLRQLVLRNWDQGLVFSLAVLGILGAHEAGHFVMTLVYRIPASFPIFIPLPISPIGTMGAVIAMNGRSANRRQIFDVGIAGPLAGLVIAIPVICVGVAQLDLRQAGYGEMAFQCPLVISWLIQWFHGSEFPLMGGVWLNQVNALFVAGWVGLVITGLNMIPVGQLDGGHVTYTLFGTGAHWIARGIIVGVIAYMVYAQTFVWLVMTAFILLIGTDHPPTSDDTQRLGLFRTVLGLASLSLPFLCFPPNVFILPG